MLLTTLEKQVQEKGKELLDYKEKHKIRLQSEMPGQQEKSGGATASSDETKSSGVLVNSWCLRGAHTANCNFFFSTDWRLHNYRLALFVK